MRRSRIALTVIAVLVALAVAGAALLWGIVRLSWFERHAGEWLSAQLDTGVSVGSLAIGYFPTPSLDIGRLVIAEGSGPQSPTLLELGRARAAVPWRTVLGGDLRLTRVELLAPRLRFGVDAQGRGNWESLAARLATLGGDEPAAWSVGTLEFDEGSVMYADARDGTVLELTGVAVTATGLVPGQHFPMQLRLAGHGTDIVMHAALSGEAMLDPARDIYAARGLALRGWLGGLGLRTGGVELAGSLEKLHADLAAGNIAFEGIRFDGLGLRLAGRAGVAGLDDDPRVAFGFGTEPFAPRAVANSLNRPLPDTADPTALARADVAAQGEYAGGVLTLRDIDAGFDDTRVTGHLTLPAAGPPRAELEFDRIDLDRYLPPDAAAAGAPRATLESLLGDLATLDVQADLRFGEAKSSGITARKLRVVIEPSRPEAPP